MFKVNDYVVYGSTGVCQITDITTEEYGNTGKIQYYVLKPVYENNMIIRVPVNNQSVLMRPIISQDDVASLIAGMPEQDASWIEDTRERNDIYKTALRSGNDDELVKIIKTIYLEKEARNAIGKKLSMTDLNIMNAAEKQLYQEIALVLNISPDEVVSYILEHIPPDKESIN